ncbi:protein of unknown function (plasmid) [Thermococcus nautili]|uniref:hypothetical protein n=1 Tax=Thermococcus nautili TaxID=195522 RepID=UPI0025546998|nr:hypothetical protein [Thermococcus nautili]CAI1494271.1 protein of unknown function [Thermococcus nautili]
MRISPTLIVGETGSGKTQLLERFREYAEIHNIPHTYREETQFPELPTFEELIRQKPREQPYLLLIDEFETLFRKNPEIWEDTIKPAVLEGRKFGIMPVIAIQKTSHLPTEIIDVLFNNSTLIILPPARLQDSPLSEQVISLTEKLEPWEAMIIHGSGVITKTKNRDIIPQLIMETQAIKMKWPRFRQ